MEIPKIKVPQLDEIKDRLGFGDGGNAAGDRRSRYDTYDDYEDEYQDGYDDGGYRDVSGSANRVDDYRATETLDASSSNRVIPAQISTSRYSSSPNLVSYDDVRAHTAATRNANRSVDGYAGTTDALSTSSRLNASAGGGEGDRSRGYDSLFGTARVRTGAARKVEVVRPFAYEDAEKIAEVLRRGDAVVLDLAATDQSLYKRILDFSFGAASMVNARVDCLASRIFSIQVGEKLNSDEMNQLRNQGVL